MSTVEPHEEEPLISRKPQLPKHSYAAIYTYLVLQFLGCLGYWIAAEAITDAQYYVICQYKGLGAEHCFQEPLANDLEGVLSSYLNTIQGILSCCLVILLARGLNKYGIRAMSLTFLVTGLLGSAAFWVVLQTPGVHYLWNIVPALLFTSSFYAVSQFLGAIYVAEMVQDANMRTTFFGWSNASVSLVEVVGPPLGGFILRHWGITAQFAASVIANTVAIVAVYLFLNEVSHVKREEQPEFIESLKLAAGLREPDPMRRRTMQKSNAFLVFTTTVFAAFGKVSKIYVKSKFGWSASENGYLTSVSSAIKFACSTAASPAAVVFLSKYFTRSTTEVDLVDKALGYWYVGVIAVSMVAGAICPTPGVFFGATLFASLSQIADAPLNAMSAKFAPENAITSYWTGLSYMVLLTLLPTVTVALRLYRKVMGVLPESYLWACTVALLVSLVMMRTIKAKV